ncbi:hypothetical protein [Solidesulfovibrio sp.]
MLKRLCCIILAGMLLAWSHTALAGNVGGELSKTEAFRQYVSTQTTLTEKISRLDATIESDKLKVSRSVSDTSLRLASMYVNFSAIFYFLSIISVITMTIYIVYLSKWNPMKWKLMTSGRTFGMLRDKLLHRNGLLTLFFLLSVLAPSSVLAKTNVLQDLKMYYTGNDFEKGYLLCKYSKGPIELRYDAVGGIAVIRQPKPGFERSFDMVAHQQGLGKSLAAEEFVPLYEAAGDDQQRQAVFSLLAQVEKDTAQSAGEQILTAMASQSGTRFDAAVGQARALLAVFSSSNNRLLVAPLVKTFLEKAVSRVRDLEGLDALVDLAVANGAFEIIREPTARALKSIPSRLPFSDTVYAARVYFKIDKDVARNYFNGIRFDFREFVKSRILKEKLVGLMRELSGVAAFLPLYESDALYKSLQQQPNDVRIAVTNIFDEVDSGLAAVAYNSISIGDNDLVFQNPETLVVFAALTAKYNKDKSVEIVNGMTKAIVERNVPYPKELLFRAVAAMGQQPATLVEGVLTHDMNTDCRFGRNAPLLLSLIEELAPDQLPAFEGYFAKKNDLAKGILDILFSKDKNAFYKLLAHVFAENPQSIANLRLPNDIFDLTAVAPAFSPDTLKMFQTVPAPLFFAQHELAKPNPDVKLVRRALIPELDTLFRTFLTQEAKHLSEEEVLEAMILLSLVESPSAAAFADEAFVLNKLVADYFGGVIGNRNTVLAQQLAAREIDFAAVEADMAIVKKASTLSGFLKVYGFLGIIYLIGTAIMSAMYACNVILPGKNFSLLNCLLHFGEASAKFIMATFVLLPAGVLQLVSVQFLRGLIARETVTPGLQECVAAFDAGYRKKEG